LCVFGDVGSDVVVADARVREVVRRAVVLDGVLGGDTGLLKTDEGALGLSHLAPVTPRALRNAVRVDAVLLLGCREASRGKKGQDDGGTHIDMSDKSWEKADGLWMDWYGIRRDGTVLQEDIYYNSSIESGEWMQPSTVWIQAGRRSEGLGIYLQTIEDVRDREKEKQREGWGWMLIKEGRNEWGTHLPCIHA
jgi:hypothetical protein